MLKHVLPGGLILGPLLFLIYINDLSKGLKMLFLDNMSFFSLIHDSNIVALELNKNLDKINRWAFRGKWALNFKPDQKKHAQGFQHKINHKIYEFMPSRS